MLEDPDIERLLASKLVEILPPLLKYPQTFNVVKDIFEGLPLFPPFPPPLPSLEIAIPRRIRVYCWNLTFVYDRTMCFGSCSSWA